MLHTWTPDNTTIFRSKWQLLQAGELRIPAVAQASVKQLIPNFVHNDGAAASAEHVGPVTQDAARLLTRLMAGAVNAPLSPPQEGPADVQAQQHVQQPARPDVVPPQLGELEEQERVQGK